MKLRYIIIILIILICKTINAQNIVVVNIETLIDNNNHYVKKINEMELSQKTYLNKFELMEEELNQNLNDIDASKLILNENEINIKIDNYNEKLTKFSILIEKFNIHYQNQILIMRENLLKEIIVLLEKYAIQNNVDLILDSKTYLIASNSIDITEYVNNELKKIKIKLEYKDFENN